MTMFICEICRTRFDEPLVRDWWETMDGDGNAEHFHQVLCPICGSPYFHEEESEDETFSKGYD